MADNKMSGISEVEKLEEHGGHVDPNPSYDHDDIHQAALADNPEKPERPSWTTLLSIGFLGLSVVSPISCGFIVAVSILLAIGTDLGDFANLGWVVNGWSIASSVSFSLAGSLSDIFGRRYVILMGQVISLIGAITCAVAPNLGTLIAGSTLLGFSCGFVLVAYAAVPEILPNRYRALGLSWIEGALAIPWVAMAVLLGNLLVLHATWRWVYYICIIYATICLIGTAIFYFPPSHPRECPGNINKTRWQDFCELDFVGTTLYTGGLTSFLLGLSWGGTTGHAWYSASVVAPLIVGALGLISAFGYDFIYVEKTGRHVLFPKHLLTKFREFTVSLVVLFVAGMVYASMANLLPQATQLVYATKPIETGLLLLPNGLGSAFGTCIVPLFLHKTGHPTRYVMGAIILQTLFTGLYAYGISGHKAAWSAFQFFGAGTFGLITITTVFNAGLHVRPSELGIAVGLLGTFRSMGGSVGNAIFGAVLRSVANTELPKRIAAAALTAGFQGELTELIPAVIETGNGIPGAFASVKGVTVAVEGAAMTAFSEAYAQAFRMVFYTTIPFGVIAVVAALFIKDSTKYMTNHVHVHLEKNVFHRTRRDAAPAMVAAQENDELRK